MDGYVGSAGAAYGSEMLSFGAITARRVAARDAQQVATDPSRKHYLAGQVHGYGHARLMSTRHAPRVCVIVLERLRQDAVIYRDGEEQGDTMAIWWQGVYDALTDVLAIVAPPAESHAPLVAVAAE